MQDLQNICAVDVRVILVAGVMISPAAAAALEASVASTFGIIIAVVVYVHVTVQVGTLQYIIRLHYRAAQAQKISNRWDAVAGQASAWAVFLELAQAAAEDQNLHQQADLNSNGEHIIFVLIHTVAVTVYQK